MLLFNRYLQPLHKASYSEHGCDSLWLWGEAEVNRVHKLVSKSSDSKNPAAFGNDFGTTQDQFCKTPWVDPKLHSRAKILPLIQRNKMLLIKVCNITYEDWIYLLFALFFFEMGLSWSSLVRKPQIEPLTSFHREWSYSLLFWYVDKTLLMSNLRETDKPEARISDVKLR